MYAAATSSGCCCLPNDTYYFLRKINSTGTTQSWGLNLYDGSSIGLHQSGGLAVDGTYIYAAWYHGTAPTRTTAIAKIDYSGTVSTNKFFNVSSGNLVPYGLVWDTASSAGYLYGKIASAAVLIKFDSSLTAAWCVTIPSFNYVDDASPNIALDSSGNIYLVGRCLNSSSNNATGIMKINSSGTLQWARSVTGGSLAGSGLTIAIYGTKFVVGGYYYAGSNYNAYTLVAPTDGSATGTYTVGGTSFVYATLSATNGTDTVSYPTSVNVVSTNSNKTMNNVSTSVGTSSAGITVAAL